MQNISESIIDTAANTYDAIKRLPNKGKIIRDIAIDNGIPAATNVFFGFNPVIAGGMAGVNSVSSFISTALQNKQMEEEAAKAAAAKGISLSTCIEYIKQNPGVATAAGLSVIGAIMLLKKLFNKKQQNNNQLQNKQNTTYQNHQTQMNSQQQSIQQESEEYIPNSLLDVISRGAGAGMGISLADNTNIASGAISGIIIYLSMETAKNLIEKFFNILQNTKNNKDINITTKNNITLKNTITLEEIKDDLTTQLDLDKEFFNSNIWNEITGYILEILNNPLLAQQLGVTPAIVVASLIKVAYNKWKENNNMIQENFYFLDEGANSYTTYKRELDALRDFCSSITDENFEKIILNFEVFPQDGRALITCHMRVMGRKINIPLEQDDREYVGMIFNGINQKAEKPIRFARFTLKGNGKVVLRINKL